MKKFKLIAVSLIVVIGVGFTSFAPMDKFESLIDDVREFVGNTGLWDDGHGVSDVGQVLDFQGDSIISINGNEPEFSDKDKACTKSFERYSDLDKLGRCGVAYACVGIDLMPTEERGEIGMIKPSGWQTVRYDDIVEGKYLYNRCHLIMYALTGENDNELNLITGTRYFNASEAGGMLRLETEVLYYMHDHPDNHVLYRVTPIYEGKNLVAKGVQMEAYSVEDKGRGVSFNVFVYNVQPGIWIDYSNGDSCRDSKMVVNNDEGLLNKLL